MYRRDYYVPAEYDTQIRVYLETCHGHFGKLDLVSFHQSYALLTCYLPFIFLDYFVLACEGTAVFILHYLETILLLARGNMYPVCLCCCLEAMVAGQPEPF